MAREPRYSDAEVLTALARNKGMCGVTARELNLSVQRIFQIMRRLKGQMNDLSAFGVVHRRVILAKLLETETPDFTMIATLSGYSIDYVKKCWKKTHIKVKEEN